MIHISPKSKKEEGKREERKREKKQLRSLCSIYSLPSSQLPWVMPFHTLTYLHSSPLLAVSLTLSLSLSLFIFGIRALDNSRRLMHASILRHMGDPITHVVKAEELMLVLLVVQLHEQLTGDGSDGCTPRGVYV